MGKKSKYHKKGKKIRLMNKNEVSIINNVEEIAVESIENTSIPTEESVETVETPDALAILDSIITETEAKMNKTTTVEVEEEKNKEEQIDAILAEIDAKQKANKEAEIDAILAELAAKNNKQEEAEETVVTIEETVESVEQAEGNIKYSDIENIEFEHINISEAEENINDEDIEIVEVPEEEIDDEDIEMIEVPEEEIDDENIEIVEAPEENINEEDIEIIEVPEENVEIIEAPEEDIENIKFEHIDITESDEETIEQKDNEQGEIQPKYVLVKENIGGKTKETFKPNIFKRIIACAAGIIGIVSIVLIAKSCANSTVTQNNNNSNNNSNSITQEDNSYTSNDLNDFSSVKYMKKEEMVTLLKNAEKEFEGTSVTTEELAAFVTEINKSSINSELREVLISSGVINEDENINRQNYLNTIDKIRNSMINAYTIEVDPELVGIPEYDALIEELKSNAIKVNVSNLVSKSSSEYEMYKLLDETYNKIGQSKTLEEAKEAYEPVLEYVNSENSKNMPNNMEEEIYKDLYKDAYDEITAAKYNVSITELDKVYCLS